MRGALGALRLNNGKAGQVFPPDPLLFIWLPGTDLNREPSG